MNNSPNFAFRSEIDAWRKWSQSSSNKPKSPKSTTPLVQGLQQAPWERFPSPYQQQCNSCRRIR